MEKHDKSKKIPTTKLQNGRNPFSLPFSFSLQMASSKLLESLTLVFASILQ